MPAIVFPANPVTTPTPTTFTQNGATYIWDGVKWNVGIGTPVDLSATQTITGAKTFTGAVQLNSGTVKLVNTTSNTIELAGYGAAAPTFTTRSIGTKYVLYPSMSGSTCDYALGIESGVLWSAVPSTSFSFKWYGGTTLAATLTGTGNLTVANLLLTPTAFSPSYASGIKFRNDGYAHFTIGSKGSSFVISNTSSNNDVWPTPTDLVTITSAGTVILAQGQIKFPATQVASSDANTLDDYEEGTWTPNLTGSGGGVYTMGGSNAGRYIKIGRLVTVYATIQWTAVTTAYTGLLYITGLPFTNGDSRCTGSIGAISSGLAFTNSNYSYYTILVDPSLTSVYIIQNAVSGLGYTHTPTVSAAGIIFGFTLSYFST